MPCAREKGGRRAGGNWASNPSSLCGSVWAWLGNWWSVKRERRRKQRTLEAVGEGEICRGVWETVEEVVWDGDQRRLERLAEEFGETIQGNAWWAQETTAAAANHHVSHKKATSSSTRCAHATCLWIWTTAHPSTSFGYWSITLVLLSSPEASSSDEEEKED